MTQHAVVELPLMDDPNYYDYFLKALKHHMADGRPLTTQAWLGDKIGLSQQMVGAILAGKKRTTARIEVKIARAFGYSGFLEFCEIGKKIESGMTLDAETDVKPITDQKGNGMAEWKELYNEQKEINRFLKTRIQELEGRLANPSVRSAR